MKRSEIRFLTLVFVLAAFVSIGSAQMRLDQPERLRLRGMAEPKAGERPSPTTLIRENFYPIGWSRDGKFAYLVEPPDEACGCYFATIVVMDLKTDKEIWTERYSSDSLAKPEDDDLSKYWARNAERFSAKLGEYGIRQHENFELAYPSAKVGSDILTPMLDSRIKTDGVFMTTGTVTLRIRSKKLGSKGIYSQRYYAKDTNGLRKVEVTGMLLSPFEPRGVVILAEEMRGYEGSPNTTRLRVVGTSFKTGFGKR